MLNWGYKQILNDTAGKTYATEQGIINELSDLIEKARKISLEAGQAKYRAYFLNTSRNASLKEETDQMLIADGFVDCIV